MLGALASYVVGHYKVGRLSAKRVQEFLPGQASEPAGGVTQ